MNCGHVHGQHSWGKDEKTDDRKCPMCMTVSFSSKNPYFKTRNSVKVSTILPRFNIETD